MTKPISNYPNGFAGGVTIRGLPLVQTHPGKIIWVGNSTNLRDSAVAANDISNGATHTQPKATLQSAIKAAKADVGDIILVLPGHAEDIDAAGAITVDKAGVAIIGLGTGSLKPKFTYVDAITSSIKITAANVTISNIEVVAGFADVTQAFDVTAKNLTLHNVSAVEAGTDLNFRDIVHCSSTTNNNADGLVLHGVTLKAKDAAQDSLLNIKGHLDGLVVEDCFVSIAAEINIATILCATGKNLTNCLIQKNRVYTLSTANDLFIDNDTTANSGIVSDNYIGHADIAGEILIDCDGVRQFNNLGTATDTASGYVLPAIDS